MVVKLAPFNEAALQHFIHLERPDGSLEPDGAGFAPEIVFTRGVGKSRLTPMGTDYETVGTFYAMLGANLSAFVAKVGESAAFCGDSGLQLSAAEANLPGTRPVICLKTALAAFNAIVTRGDARSIAAARGFERVSTAPRVFLANVQGPWIHPDAMEVESLVAIAHVCPSGAIRYRRKDGKPDEAPPPVNLIAVREAGPYAVRADIRLDGVSAHYRATLCRCGASKNKPFCDGTHASIGFRSD